MPLRPEEKSRDADDELDELPPIDGDADADDEAEPDPEELDEETGDGGDPLDDSTGEDDPVDELDASESETGWLDDADEDEGLDVGAPDTLGDEGEIGALLEGAEETDVGEDDLTFGSEDDAIAGDAGEEGFVDEEDALREEDLPRLDAGDDDAEIDEADLSDAIPDEEAADEEPLPPWDDRAWDRVDGAAGGLAGPIAAVSAMVCAGASVVVGGEGLARVDAAGKVTALEALGLRGGAPTAIAATDAWIALVTPRAGVLVSRDAGRSFTEVNGWRASATRADGTSELTTGTLASLVSCGEELWGRTRGGVLVWSGDHGATWAGVTSCPRVDALAVDATTGEAVGIARSDANACVLVRGTGGRVSASPCGPLPPGSILGLAASGGRVAVGLTGRGAFRLDDAGAFARLEGTASLTALAYASNGTLVVALCSEGEASAWIVEARGADGPARIVAELGEPSTAPEPREDREEEGDARVRALAWDDARGVMWGAGAFGLVALRPARR